jgi:hypothetical protein
MNSSRRHQIPISKRFALLRDGDIGANINEDEESKSRRAVFPNAHSGSESYTVHHSPLKSN